ncbi:RraA family protein [Paenibacillus koleovorans]|uniref:RraA family protein n=1 Tax=Paenibacillus koleovorans TaxID=121608 RepID=UPI000FD6D311|nr:RraA family protein [Paenibacillus koleovorans]
MNFYPSAALSDAMNKMFTMDAGIKPLKEGYKMIGIAYTVKCYPGSIITCHKALGEVPSGSVLVIDGGGSPEGALFGELTSMEAMERGVKGIVVDGAVRDVALIRSFDFPAFTRHVTPRVGTNKTIGTTGEAVVCGGVVVHTGDLIIGDDDGVVVVPKEQIEEMLQAAAHIEELEADIARKVKDGAHIADLIGFGPMIAAASAAQKK